MHPKTTTTTNTATLPCSLSSLFFTFIFLFLLSSFFFFFFSSNSNPSFPVPQHTLQIPQNPLKVYIADLPRSLNYGLLDQYWSSSAPDSRISSDPDHPRIQSGSQPTHLHKNTKFPDYPENPLIKQYSAEYWITGDLMTPEIFRTQSYAKRVFDVGEADVVFVPFFATLSAEMELGKGKGTFRRKEGNEDYKRQKEAIEFVKNSEAWKQSGGRDHVFVLTGSAFD